MTEEVVVRHHIEFSIRFRTRLVSFENNLRLFGSRLPSLLMEITTNDCFFECGCYLIWARQIAGVVYALSRSSGWFCKR